jgi:hypothetical protein
MSQLTIRSDPSMGPLEVSVYPPDGEPIEFTLSSGLTQEVIPAEAGRYAIVARRPNGARLNKTVQVEGGDETVLLSSAVGQSPNKFMIAETVRGQVTRASEAESAASWRDALIVARRKRYPDANLVAASPSSKVTIEKSTAEEAPEAARAEILGLRLWLLDETGKWNALGTPSSGNYMKDTIAAGDFLKVGLDCKGALIGLGLIDAQGFGPIVNVPPFAERVEVTFLSKGVLAQAADRTANPAGQRVPVALVTPSNHAAADLLAALAAPATPPAEAIWNQTISGLVGPTGLVEPEASSVAMDMLLEKFARPAEAILAAHYLLRFLPKRLPIAWADNLVHVLPMTVDGCVIAAWARLLNRPDGATDEEIDEAIDRYIKMALTRPTTLFARTRALLTDARHLVSGKSEGELWRREDQFWRSGAGAGGLECFWGGGPTLPGARGGTETAVDLVRVGLVNGGFTASGSAQPPGGAIADPHLP